MIYIVTISLILMGFAILYLILVRKINSSVNPKALIDEIRVEVDRIILQLNNTTERNINIIEDKINELSDLMDKADKKIALLRRESEKYSMSKNYSNILTQNKKDTEKSPEIKKEVDVKDQVLKLYREGFSTSVIANHMNLPIGEVELIISLTGR
ncbi:MAG: hypothetical protein JXJ04_00710 [Spirochaetales bacterium]|nr:hypothetical protein [Spirochaetales bacterium]